MSSALDLLEELMSADTYSTEYDGRMMELCHHCNLANTGEHSDDCVFVRARALLDAKKPGWDRPKPARLMYPVECDICKKRVAPEGLRQHKRDKHGIGATKPKTEVPACETA